MAKRTRLQPVLPWSGGINTSQDPALIPANELVQADNVVFAERTTKKKREGIDSDFDDATNGTDSLIGIKDFWYFSAGTKNQKIVSVDEGGNVYSYNPADGTRTTETVTGTAISSPTKVSMEVIDNTLVIATDGASNVLKAWSGTGNVVDLSGTAPAGSIVRAHLGRLWTNDKTNPDRLHYSETFDATVWGGSGDSGALDIGIGDGDPEGITAIFPTFKGELFVAKRTKLYRVSGLTPEDFRISLVSDGIGCVSHNSIAAVDQDDMIFISDRGIHSLVTTEQFGDFKDKFLSAKIQPTFNDDFGKSFIEKTQSAYIPNLNSVAFIFSDESVLELGSVIGGNAVWLYNFQSSAWYRWPAVDCQSLASVKNSDKRRLYIGSSTTRLQKAQTGTAVDTDTSGTESGIPLKLKTGVIFPENEPYLIKGFKNIIAYYRPTGPSTLTVSAKIDNFSRQSVAFEENVSGAVLGTGLILGASELGFSRVLAPYSRPIDGYGRGYQLEFSQSGIEETVEIQGFGVEYEISGTSQEVRSGD